MKNIFLGLFLLSLLLITGCSRPNALSNFEKEELYSKALQYTFKRDIYKNNEITAMMNVTYLNSVSKEFNSNTEEQFVIGIYLPNYENTKNEDYLKEMFSLTLNEVTTDYAEVLTEKHKLYGKLPLFNPWAKYYLVKFNKNKINKKYRENFTTYEKYNNLNYKSLSLKLTDSFSNSALITFQKEY